jgi:hypothetical protein
MNVLNILTLGILPVARMLMSTGPEDPRRFYYASISFSRFGNPKIDKAIKVLKKVYASEKERKVQLKNLQQGNYLMLYSEEQAEKLIDLLEDQGFDLDDDDVSEWLPPLYWNEDRERYERVDQFNFCNSCGRKGVRLYRNWDNDEISCSSCGSTDILRPEDMTTKEFLKHVEKFPTLSSAGAGGEKRAASRGANRSEAVAVNDLYEDDD